MKMSVHKNIIFAHQKVAKKAFKMNSFLIYTFLKILVVGTHKSIAEGMRESCVIGACGNDASLASALGIKCCLL